MVFEPQADFATRGVRRGEGFMTIFGAKAPAGQELVASRPRDGFKEKVAQLRGAVRIRRQLQPGSESRRWERWVGALESLNCYPDGSILVGEGMCHAWKGVKL